MQRIAQKYLRKESFPILFCSGCGNGIVLGSTIRALDELDIPHEKVALVGGIGCSGWIPVYVKADVLHTIHGRALAFATGLKLANPDLKVIVFTGDGDGASIGGNHLIHAARRNIDIVVILVNNMLYGMTGGQVAPTTPLGATTMTTPYGNIERPFDLARLVIAAGGTYVARWTTAHPIQLKQSIKKAIMHKGFSFIEVISQCPTQFGRYVLHQSSPQFLIRWLKENSIPLSKAKNMKPEEIKDKIIVGEFVEKIEPEYTEKVFEIIEKGEKHE